MVRRYNKYLDRIIIFFLIFVLPIIITFIVEHFIDYSKIAAKNYDGIAVSGTMMGVWAAMLGFMITALSILMALGDGDFITTIRGTPHFKTIIIIMVSSCLILFLATGFCASIVCLHYWSRCCFSLLLYFVFGTAIGILLSMLFLFYILLSNNN